MRADRPLRLPLQLGTSALTSLVRGAAFLIPGAILFGVPLGLLIYLLYFFVRNPNPHDPAGAGDLALWTTLSFLLGAACSVASGYMGMWVAIRANIRTAAAAREGRRVCYVGAQERLAAALAARGPVARLAIGAQPVWDPRGWPAIVATKSSLRAQLARARNKGIYVEGWHAAMAAGHPEVRRCLVGAEDTRAAD